MLDQNKTYRQSVGWRLSAPHGRKVMERKNAKLHRGCSDRVATLRSFPSVLTDTTTLRGLRDRSAATA